jgi:hypothetical protein
MNSVSTSSATDPDNTKVGTKELEMLAIALHPTGVPTNSSH